MSIGMATFVPTQSLCSYRLNQQLLSAEWLKEHEKATPQATPAAWATDIDGLVPS